MSQGAPLGNQNARKGKVWADGIRRAIRENVDGEDFEAKVATLARAVVLKALEGDQQAYKEIGDRLDGRPAQALEHSGPDGGPVETVTRFKLADLG